MTIIFFLFFFLSRNSYFFRIQHHLAHAVAVWAEHGCFPERGEQVAAIVLDGTGSGPDGTAWGGEWLLLDGELQVKRAAYLEPFPLVIEAANRVRLPDLGHRHHVQRMVEPPIPGAGEPMPDLLAGGDVDRCGAVIRRDVIFQWESVDRVDLGQDPASDDRPDDVELGEPGAGGVDQRGDLPADRFIFVSSARMSFRCCSASRHRTTSTGSTGTEFGQ